MKRSERTTEPLNSSGLGARLAWRHIGVSRFGLTLVILIVLLAIGYAAKRVTPTVEVLPQQATSAKELSQPALPPATDLAATQDQDYSQPGVPASSIAGKDHRIETVYNDQRIALRNGGRINLGDGLSMEVFVDPYPPTRLKAWVDLYLTREPDGQPVTDAEISMEYDMLFMYHGPFKATADNLGDGHYLFTLDYIMYGAWDQGVEIRLPDERYETVLIVIAYP